MNQHLAKAIHDYTSKNINFTNIIDWHFCNGFVLCQPDCFGIGFFSDSDDPTTSVERHHSNTLFVTYCAGYMQPIMRPFQDQFDYIAFSRDFSKSPKIRLWDYQKTLNRIK